MILPLSALYLAGHGAYRALGFRSRTLRTEVRNLHVYDRAGLGRAPPVLLVLGEPAVLVGNSLGGAICLHCAIALPDKVVGVVGLNPAGAPLAGADREAVLRAFTSTTPRAAMEMNRRLYRHPPKLSWLF